MSDTMMTDYDTVDPYEGDAGGPYDQAIDGARPDDTASVELALIGAVLTAKTIPPALLDRLHPEQFGHPSRGALWRVLVDLALAGEELDITRVSLELQEADPQAMWALRRSVSAVAMVTDSTLASYADQIMRGHRARQARAALLRAEQLLSLGRVDDALQAMSEGAAAVEPEGYGLTFGQVFDELLEEAKQPPRITPTPWHTVNEHLYGGFTAGRLYVVCGTPGTGKTVTAQCVAAHAVHTQRPVMLFSLEMQRTEIARRLLATAAGVSMSEVMRHDLTLSRESWEKVDRFRKQADDLLIINDQLGLTVERVRNAARIAARRHNIGLVVVDYLQLVNAPERYRTETEQVKYVARSLKDLSKELRLPVVALAQPNRNSSYREGGRLQISDLHGSSEIEKAADVIVLLNRVTDEDEGDVPANLVDFDIDKNRQGRTGRVRMLFDGSLQSFIEV